MTVFRDAILLAVMIVAVVFAGSDAWSGEVIPPIIVPRLAGSSIGTGVEDHLLTIVIRPAVNLEASETNAGIGDVTLAEIVDPATIPIQDREAVMRHLQAVALTDRPKIGEERTFTQEGLEAIVGEASRRLEAAGYTIEWKIPRRSNVLRKNTFSREAVTKHLQEELTQKCSGCEAIIRRLDWPRIEGLAIQSWRLNMRNEKPRGSFAVPIEFDLADGTKKTMNLTGLVEFFAQVPVTTRAIQGAEKISANDFKMERKNVTYGLDAAADVKDFENSVVVRSMSLGEPLWKSSIRREQLVKFGDPVRVQVGGETWNVTSEGVAQGPAAIGESVRVKVGKTQKLVSGILKEKGLVEIQ